MSDEKGMPDEPAWEAQIHAKNGTENTMAWDHCVDLHVFTRFKQYAEALRAKLADADKLLETVRMAMGTSTVAEGLNVMDGLRGWLEAAGNPGDAVPFLAETHGMVVWQNDYDALRAYAEALQKRAEAAERERDEALRDAERQGRGKS